MNFEKLKETARKYEQKEEWRRAIEVYLQAIREFEAGNDPVPDLSVYNRVGDLYLKANEPGAAVQAYERAADLYGEQGFYNNAIALCGKILRVNPGRIQTYLKLAHLHARKNVVIEAKKNLLEYLERMNTLNQLDDAFKSVKDFADQFPGNKEIRLMLSELLRASSRNAEAREQLEKLATDLEARGDTVGARKTLMRMQALDVDEVPAEPARPAAPKGRSGDLVFLDTRATAERLAVKPVGPVSRKGRAVTLPLVAAPDPPVPEPATLETEPASPGATPMELESLPLVSEEAQLEASASEAVAKALGFEPTFAEGQEAGGVAPLDGLEMDVAEADTVDLQAAPEGLDLERVIEPGGSDVQPIEADHFLLSEPLGASAELVDGLVSDLGDPESSPGWTAADLGMHPVNPIEPMVAAGDVPAEYGTDDATVTFLDADGPHEPSIIDLEDRVLDDPDDPEAHRALGEALLATGEQLRGQEELELALAGYEGREDWHHATGLIHELIRLDPNGVRYHQKRVEIAFRSGERPKLIEAYLELADALLRVGALDKALAVYRRVSEHDSGNSRALAALDALSSVEDNLPPIPPPPAAPARVSRPVAPLAEMAEAAEAALDAISDGPLPPVPAGKPPRKSAPVQKVPAHSSVDNFIDLGALVMDDEAVKDTRMRVEGEEPTGDEQADFQEMLQQFKRGIDANIDAEDFQAHYDLGVAFKEMGLLDEAIAEFQKALRSPEVRLKTTESLGSAFFEKRQYAIAEAILKRAVESLGATDDEQIGVIYWLARSQEEQGKAEQAITTFERVMAVDIGFQDAGARMAKLSELLAR